MRLRTVRVVSDVNNAVHVEANRRGFERPGKCMAVVPLGRYAPHDFIRNCAHLVGEAILVPAVCLRGDGYGAGRVSDVLSYRVPVGVADLHETCSRGARRIREQKMLTQKSMSR